MPPPSNSNHPDVDEVRRRAGECARHVYPDVCARFEARVRIAHQRVF